MAQIARWSLHGRSLEDGDEDLSSALETLSLQDGVDNGAGRCFSLEEILDVKDLKSIPVVFIPTVIGQMIFAHKWHHMAFKASWAQSHFTAWIQHLPQSWLRDRMGEKENDLTPAVLDKKSSESCIRLMRAAGEQLQVQGLLDDGMRENLNQCMAALSRHCFSLCPLQKSFLNARSLTESFVHQILAAMDLRNRGLLRRHAKRFLRFFPEAVRPSMQFWADKALKSRSSLNRGQLYLDIAMLLFHSERLLKLGPLYRYAWGDASSKGQLEVYNMRYRFLPQADAVALARAWKWLCSHVPRGCLEAMVTMRLTAQGMSQLNFNHVLTNPMPLDSPRSIECQELTTLELMVMMSQQGWVWSPLPQKVSDRQNLVYKLGEPLMWYSGKVVHNSYLRCLLEAERLKTQHGVQEVPHGRAAEVYDLLLTGVQPTAAITTSGRRSEKRPLQLLDVELDGVVGQDAAMPKTKKPRRPKTPGLLEAGSGGEGSDAASDAPEPSGVADEIHAEMPPASGQESLEEANAENNTHAEMPSFSVPESVEEANADDETNAEMLPVPPVAESLGEASAGLAISHEEPQQAGCRLRFQL
eukprot:Skav214780  [mRNA]  locus=scaffold1820:422:5230:- [translate_table: standard]